MGLDEQEIDRRVRSAMELVGLDWEEFAEKSPFELSGGEKRRAALAGIIAMEPRYIVLDEPMAGLDPGGRREILQMLERLRQDTGCAVIMVSHSMDDVAAHAQRVLVLDKGKWSIWIRRSASLPMAENCGRWGCPYRRPAACPCACGRRGCRCLKACTPWIEWKMAAGGASMTDITLGQFVPGQSCIHRLDPRTKILLMLAYIAMVFLVNTMTMFLVPLIYVGVTLLLARIPLSYMHKAIKPIRLLMVFMFVLNLFVTPGKELIWQWWILKITRESLRQAVFITLRLVFLITGTSLMTLTTSPIALTDGLEKLLSPLKALKFPAHELAMMMTIALRFIPTLMEEADKIRKAQMARGVDFESGNLIERAKAMLPILIPLFVSAFRRADELAMAMESRCYHGGEVRTRMHQLRFGRNDLWAGLTTVVAIALVPLLQHLIPQML